MPTGSYRWGINISMLLKLKFPFVSGVEDLYPYYSINLIYHEYFLIIQFVQVDERSE